MLEEEKTKGLQRWARGWKDSAVPREGQNLCTERIPLKNRQEAFLAPTVEEASHLFFVLLYWGCVGVLFLLFVFPPLLYAF